MHVLSRTDLKLKQAFSTPVNLFSIYMCSIVIGNVVLRVYYLTYTMRLAAAVTLLAAAAASDTQTTGENQSTLSRRHLLYHKHRLFPQKVRLDHRNGESDSPIKHKKKSKMGSSWYDLDAANSLVDVEEQEEEEEEKQVLEKQAHPPLDPASQEPAFLLLLPLVLQHHQVNLLHQDHTNCYPFLTSSCA